MLRRIKYLLKINIKSLNYCAILLYLIIFSSALPLQSQADDSALIIENHSNSEKAQPTNALFDLYREHISAVDGDRCGMSPSCSGYGEQAIKKHGLFMGWIMTCDRLIRCGRDETHISRSIRSNGKLLTLDPLEANDFWWYPYSSSK